MCIVVCICAGFYLLGRVIVATSCVTLATSLAARLGSTPMAAFQICLQVWMTSSLLAFGLGGGGQVVSLLGLHSFYVIRIFSRNRSTNVKRYSLLENKNHGNTEDLHYFITTGYHCLRIG